MAAFDSTRLDPIWQHDPWKQFLHPPPPSPPQIFANARDCNATYGSESLQGAEMRTLSFNDLEVAKELIGAVTKAGASRQVVAATACALFRVCKAGSDKDFKDIKSRIPNFMGSHGSVAMTSASHAEGREFESHLEYFPDAVLHELPVSKSEVIITSSVCELAQNFVCPVRVHAPIQRVRPASAFSKALVVEPCSSIATVDEVFEGDYETLSQFLYCSEEDNYDYVELCSKISVIDGTVELCSCHVSGTSDVQVHLVDDEVLVLNYVQYEMLSNFLECFGDDGPPQFYVAAKHMIESMTTSVDGFQLLDDGLASVACKIGGQPARLSDYFGLLRNFTESAVIH